MTYPFDPEFAAAIPTMRWSGSLGADRGVAVQDELAHQCMAAVLGRADCTSHSLRGPPGTEVVVLEGQFAGAESRVVRVPGGFPLSLVVLR